MNVFSSLFIIKLLRVSKVCRMLSFCVAGKGHMTKMAAMTYMVITFFFIKFSPPKYKS